MNEWELKTSMISECRRQAINKLNEFKVKPVYITLSGSHLYGFPSKDSDIDIRCCHIMDSKELFHLTRAVETDMTDSDSFEESEEKPLEEKRHKQMRDKTNVLQWDGEIEIDEKKTLIEFESMEIKKVICLAMANNSNILEHIFSKNLLTSPPTEYMRMKELTKQSMSKIVFNPYHGLGEANYKKFIDSMNPTYRDKLVKKYLYVMRAYLVGAHALRTGEIEPCIRPHIRALENEDDRNLINELIEKKEDAEYQITAIDHKRCREVVARLKGRLEIAKMESNLPDIPTNQAAWDNFFYNVRLRNL
jgi:predicted nucleotidyltransferase